MASRSNQIAQAIVAMINGLTLPQTMPMPNPLAKVALHPKIKREKDNSLRVFVVYAGRSTGLAVAADRCGREWSSRMTILISRRLDNQDTDQEQQGTLLEIDRCCENSEFIAEAIGNKAVAGAKMLEVDHPILAEESWALQGMFYSEITAVFK
jgi:hypothetical protein